VTCMCCADYLCYIEDLSGSWRMADQENSAEFKDRRGPAERHLSRTTSPLLYLYSLMLHLLAMTKSWRAPSPGLSVGCMDRPRTENGPYKQSSAATTTGTSLATRHTALIISCRVFLDRAFDTKASLYFPFFHIMTPH